MKDLEHMFFRAWQHSFSRKKFFMLFPFLALSGLVAIFCRALAFHAGDWIKMSMGFLPVLLIAAILLCAGIPLIRSYHDEVKGHSIKWLRTLQSSAIYMWFAVRLFLPVLLFFCVLWMAMGIFYLLKMIPHVGSIVGALVSFGPFLLVVISLLLCLASVGILFLAAPAISLKSWTEWKDLRHYLARFQDRILLHLGLFSIALLPVLASLGILIFGAHLTDTRYLNAQHLLTLSVQWFFLMIPFAAILTPVITFFFNFSAEAFAYITKAAKNS